MFTYKLLYMNRRVTNYRPVLAVHYILYNKSLSNPHMYSSVCRTSVLIHVCVRAMKTKELCRRLNSVLPCVTQAGIDGRH